MNTTTEKKPTLKFKLNVPYVITFETDPTQAKEYHSEQYNTNSYLYFISEGGIEQVWFATEMQHRELKHAGVKKGENYKIVKEEVEGKKYTNFWIYDVVSGEKLNGTHASEVSAEEIFGPSPEQPTTHAHKAPIHDPVRHNPQELGMCFKIACHIAMGNKEIITESVKTDTMKLYNLYQELKQG